MPPNPSDQDAFEAVRAELGGRFGEDSAITLAGLAARVGVSRRKVEVILECRLPDLGFAVVSGDRGLYRPVSAGELNHYDNSLRSRIRCIAIRARTVRRAALREGWVREGKRFVARPVQGSLSL
jgi:hypothetical protein